VRRVAGSGETGGNSTSKSGGGTVSSNGGRGPWDSHDGGCLVELEPYEGISRNPGEWIRSALAQLKGRRGWPKLVGGGKWGDRLIQRRGFSGFH